MTPAKTTSLQDRLSLTAILLFGGIIILGVGLRLVHLPGLTAILSILDLALLGLLLRLRGFSTDNLFAGVALLASCPFAVFYAWVTGPCTGASTMLLALLCVSAFPIRGPAMVTAVVTGILALATAALWLRDSIVRIFNADFGTMPLDYNSQSFHHALMGAPALGVGFSLFLGLAALQFAQDFWSASRKTSLREAWMGLPAEIKFVAFAGMALVMSPRSSQTVVLLPLVAYFSVFAFQSVSLRHQGVRWAFMMAVVVSGTTGLMQAARMLKNLSSALFF